MWPRAREARPAVGGSRHRPRHPGSSAVGARAEVGGGAAGALGPLAPSAPLGPLALLVVLAMLASALVAAEAASGQTLDDLADAEERAAQIDAELDRATQRFESTWASVEQLHVELDELRARAADLEHEAAEIEARLEERARLVFKHGSTVTMQTLLNSSSAQEAVERAGLLAMLHIRDGAELEEAHAARVGVDQARAYVNQRELDLLALLEQLEADAAVLEERLAVAEAEVAAIEAVTSRQKRIDRGSQRGIYACIFAPGAHHFRDTWGAPRSGGRRHKGTDVFAAYGTPVFAFTNGVIKRHSSSALGGIGLYLRGEDGHVYYYAHLDSIDPSASVGARVTAGQQVGRNGSTGNAPRSAPHVHFEVAPGGGSAVNPYPWLAAACY